MMVLIPKLSFCNVFGMSSRWSMVVLSKSAASGQNMFLEEFLSKTITKELIGKPLGDFLGIQGVFWTFGVSRCVGTPPVR